MRKIRSARSSKKRRRPRRLEKLKMNCPSGLGSQRGRAGCNVVLSDHNHAVGHSAYHMLHTPEKLVNVESCALCLGPATDCPALLMKTGPELLQPRIFCQVFSPGASLADPNSAVKLTHAGMFSSTPNLPSTNIPIICPLCQQGLADLAHCAVGAAASAAGKRKKNGPPS